MILKLTQTGDKGDPVWINTEYVVTINLDQRGARISFANGKEIVVAETPDKIQGKAQRAVAMS